MTRYIEQIKNRPLLFALHGSVYILLGIMLGIFNFPSLETSVLVAMIEFVLLSLGFLRFQRYQIEKISDIFKFKNNILFFIMISFLSFSLTMVGFGINNQFI